MGEWNFHMVDAIDRVFDKAIMLRNTPPTNIPNIWNNKYIVYFSIIVLLCVGYMYIYVKNLKVELDVLKTLIRQLIAKNNINKRSTSKLNPTTNSISNTSKTYQQTIPYINIKTPPYTSKKINKNTQSNGTSYIVPRKNKHVKQTTTDKLPKKTPLLIDQETETTENESIYENNTTNSIKSEVSGDYAVEGVQPYGYESFSNNEMDIFFRPISQQ